jgi:DNA-binding GntR family transcriptional regulator
VQVHKTKAELALEGFREAILRGQIRAGERVTLAQLSTTLGMSVTPIREAIRALEAEGLVTNEPHRGVTVNDLTLADAEELYMLRAPMESLATRLAVPLLNEHDIGRLDDLIADMERAVERGDDAGLSRANGDWHFFIYSASRTKHVLKNILRLWMPYHWSSPNFWNPDQRDESLREHAAIMDAIRARDADAASRLMHDHISHAHGRLLRRLRGGEVETSTLAMPADISLEELLADD